MWQSVGKINECVSEMLRLSHLLFSPRAWHLIDGTLLSMQIASPWLICMFVCGKMYGKMVDFFGILNYSWGSSILQVVLAEDLGVFQPAPHEMPSPAAGSACHSAVHFLSLTSLPVPVSLGLLARESSTLQPPARIWRCQMEPSEDVFHLMPLSLSP